MFTNCLTRQCRRVHQIKIRQLDSTEFNPLVPDAHYSERQGKPFSLQIQQLEVDLK